MKLSVILLLVSLMLTLTAPCTFTISLSDNVTVLVTHDVCNASHAAISANADTPAVQQSICTLVPVGPAGYIETDKRQAKAFIVVFNEDHPPET